MPSAASSLTLNAIAEEVSPHTDVELIRQCASGSTGALGELFDRHHARVRSFLFRMCGAHGDIDDLVQSTFLEAMIAAPRFRGDSQATTWLLGIAANLARSRHRKARRFTDELADVSDTALTPYDRAVRNQVVSRLQPALEALSPQLREAFVMCDLEQVRCVDAARVLGIPEGTLARRLHEARCKIRESILDGKPRGGKS